MMVWIMDEKCFVSEDLNGENDLGKLMNTEEIMRDKGLARRTHPWPLKHHWKLWKVPYMYLGDKYFPTISY